MQKQTPIRQRDLEESAQGHDFFKSPGNKEMIEQAKDQASASGWLPDDLVYDWPPLDTRQLITKRRRDLYESMRAVEAAIARASGQPDWKEVTEAALVELRSCLQRHNAETEGRGGLFEEVVDHAPHLSSVVDDLRQEHTQLLTDCVYALELVSDEAEPDEVRRAAMRMLGRLAIHRQNGAELLFDTYNVDIAAGD